MLNRSLKPYRLFSLLKINNLQIQTDKTLHSCLCGQVFIKRNQRLDSSIFNLRVHSTQSDQHRQKVIIETSTPAIDKFRLGKVLPLDEKVDEKSYWKDRIYPYVQLARWDKPIGVYLLYWPCAWSISLASVASGAPPPAAAHAAALFLLGAGLMRGAGCTINDMWDKDIDKQVERTSGRPLVTGAVSYRQATGFLAAQLAAALAVLLQLNCTSVALGAASTIVVVLYPLAKRFTNYPQVFLGATFNWGALLGYSAVAGHVEPRVCVPLYLGALAWTVVYDTIYAHQDKLDDARIGMKSTALTFGARTRPALAAALVSSAALLAAAGAAAELDAPYYLALAAYCAHVGRQIYTLDIDNPQDCADKFKSNSLVGLIILLGILAGGYTKYHENRAKGYTGESAESCLFG